MSISAVVSVGCCLFELAVLWAGTFNGPDARQPISRHATWVVYSDIMSLLHALRLVYLTWDQTGVFSWCLLVCTALDVSERFRGSQNKAVGFLKGISIWAAPSMKAHPGSTQLWTSVWAHCLWSCLTHVYYIFVKATSAFWYTPIGSYHMHFTLVIKCDWLTTNLNSLTTTNHKHS